MMFRPKPSAPSARAMLACLVGLGLVSGCGPQTTAPAPAEAPAQSSTAAGKAGAINQPLTLTPEETQANLDRLNGLPLTAPAKWNMADGVIVSATAENAALGSAKALRLTPTGGVAFHRIGLEGQYGDGPMTYRVTVWVKAPPGTGVKLEARGKTLLNSSRAAEYATQYFDVAKAKPESNKLATDETRFGAATITKDGEWSKISTDMTTRDGWIFFVIGLTTKGEHVFAGTSDIELTLGGVTVAPAA
jgi:hypothetical protein